MPRADSPTDAASSKLDAGDVDRKLIAERVLKRVRLSKATRTLQTRLSLASFKASRGWHNVTFDVIEPHMTQAAQQRVLRNGSPSRGPDRSHRHYPADPAPTTYLTPDRRRTTSLYPALQPVKRPSSNAPPTFSEFSHAIPHSDPVRRSTYRHVSANESSLKRSSPHDVFQTSKQLPHTPLGPEASNSNEYVAAANVLSSLSRAPSVASFPSASPLAWPRSCPPGPTGAQSRNLPGASRTSHTPEGSPLPIRSHHSVKSLIELEEDEAQANAAELMLFLAAGSPSPARRPGTQTETPSAEPDPTTARRLFSADKSRDVTPPTLTSHGKQQDRGIEAVVLSVSSSQTSSRSANSTVSIGSTSSCCGQAIEDLIQLASTPDQRVCSVADARAKILGRSLVRAQTQPVIGAEAKVW